MEPQNAYGQKDGGFIPELLRTIICGIVGQVVCWQPRRAVHAHSLWGGRTNSLESLNGKMLSQTGSVGVAGGLSAGIPEPIPVLCVDIIAVTIHRHTAMKRNKRGGSRSVRFYTVGITVVLLAACSVTFTFAVLFRSAMLDRNKLSGLNYILQLDDESKLSVLDITDTVAEVLCDTRPNCKDACLSFLKLLRTSQIENIEYVTASSQYISYRVQFDNYSEYFITIRYDTGGIIRSPGNFCLFYVEGQ